MDEENVVNADADQGLELARGLDAKFRDEVDAELLQNIELAQQVRLVDASIAPSPASVLDAAGEPETRDRSRLTEAMNDQYRQR